MRRRQGGRVSVSRDSGMGVPGERLIQRLDILGTISQYCPGLPKSQMFRLERIQTTVG